MASATHAAASLVREGLDYAQSKAVFRAARQRARLRAPNCRKSTPSCRSRPRWRRADQNRKLATQVAELKANQEHQRVAFEQRFATLERALAAKAGDGKLAAAFNR